ncbi:MAG: hypothetical protein J5747_11485 [Spirochaetaceae bacterium]|nr:hypothetical protein [Spirochaetaceae bacterium]
MSKEALKQLNQKLIQHFEKTGIKNALYYEPLFDYYWLQKDKIGLCNLESYDTNFKGINKITPEIILDCWSKAPTIQKSMKIFQAITWELENGRDISEKEIKQFDNKDWGKAIDEMGCGLYFNLRLTIGNQVNEDKKGIEEFYNDPFYIEYFRKFIEISELRMLIITGETGVNIINKIYPELKLDWASEKQAKRLNGILFCSMQHPSRMSYKTMATSLNYFFDEYFK